MIKNIYTISFIFLIVVLFILIKKKNNLENFKNLEIDKINKINKIIKNKINKNTITNNTVNKIFYINLERHIDRRRYMEKQFKNNNLNVVRYNAFDKNRTDDNYLDNMIKNNLLEGKSVIKRKKKQGSLACLISHTELWRKILTNNININNNSDYYLIFEDDCKILPKFNEKLKFYLKHIPNDADMVWLGYNRIKGKKVNEYFYKPYQGWNKGFNSQHHCYLVNKKGIKKLLKIIIPLKYSFHTKDTLIKMNFDKFNPYFLREKLAVQDLEEFPISDRTGMRNG